MAQRKTRKAGILQSRHSDPKVQKTFDAIIERLEVLDGLRGDELDRAVTYRDLSLSGFTVLSGAGGPYITDSPTDPGAPGGDDGPGVGPAAPPTNLAVNETFLALLLTWDNPSFNLQHIEVWRNSVDNLSTATLIGTTVSPQYMDYVGASASFYYWVRSVGTDGTFSAFNATAGTLGTTGIDPSDFEFNLNISASNLDTALAARIDLIDVDGVTDSLMTRVAAAQGDIVAIDQRTTTLESTASGLQTSIDGNTDLIGANALIIGNQTTSINTLLQDLGVAQGDIADNTLAITSNASSILNLEATVGALDAEGGQEWEFLTDTDGWTATNASLTHSGTSPTYAILTPSASNPHIESPTFGLSGGIYTQVVMRVRRAQGGGTWEGKCSYATGSHPASDTNYYKQIAEPDLPLNTWKTLTWDMSDLTFGSTDWVSSTITGLRFDLVSDAAGKFDIDWIIIAKFSTTAIAEAIDALDVRVTSNADGLLAQASDITALTTRLDDPSTGLAANASAITALTTTVNVTQDNRITANASAITALDTKVYDPALGAVAQSTAFTQLQTDVSDIEGVNTSQASDLTQLVARISGGYASIVNPLNVTGENFGTDYTTSEIQAYNIGGRNGVAARIDTAVNVSDYVYRSDGARIYVQPNDIYEVKFSVYHNRPTDAGSFYAGLSAYTAATGGSAQNVTTINNRVAGSSNSNPYWLSFQGASHDEEWLDVTCYILGSNVDASVCPNMVINGDTGTTGYSIFNDGYKIVSAPYVHLRFLNFNGSPSYGDDTTTTTFVTNLQVHRIDSAAENYAAIETSATVTANQVGDLNALYAVKAELNANGDPYVTGFGLAADVINGVASSAFGIRADQFFITSPSNPVDTAVPFSVGLVDGSATVGIRGELIVDGTIRASSIVANSIGADRINVNQLSAISADMGTLTAGLLRTAASPAWRVEIQDAASTAWPIWYGSNAKSAVNGRFYVTNTGDVVIKGLLDAGMIKQSYFTPADGNNSHRIACEYYSNPSTYSGGIYTGKAAHINPVLTTGYNAPENSDGPDPYDRTNFNTSINLSQHRCGWHSNSLTFYSPTYSGTLEYGRLGSLSENMLIRYSVTMNHDFGNPYHFWVIVKYKYDSEVERFAYIQHYKFKDAMRIGVLVAEDIFVTRDTSWNTLSFRIGVGVRRSDETSPGTAQRAGISNANLSVETANMGYADQGVTNTTSTTSGASVPLRNSNIIRRYY